MGDIASVLAQLGLRHYADALAAAGVTDLDTLRLLTDADLKELGLLLGHRRRLLAVVAHGGAGAPSAIAAGVLSEATTAAERHGPERRYLTVLFCDLVGWTELTRRLDPEDIGRIARAYQDAVAGTIGRFGGFVDRFLGDGVLAFFGYPRAHENAAELAVRAGLEIVAAIGGLTTPSGNPLAARVAAASGLVFIDQVEARSNGTRGERVVAGEVMNLAARLQAIAPANGVVVSSETRTLLRGLFDLEDLGAHELKGTGRPVRTWRVTRERSGTTRFQAAQLPNVLAPLVGREAELALLESRWEVVSRSGEAQLVLVSGEAGIGKSRLCQALCEHIRGEPHFVLRYQCSPLHTHSALYPVIAQLRRAARIEPDLSAEEKVTRLEALLALSSPALERDMPLLATLLSIPGEPLRHKPSQLAPEERKLRTLEALVDQLFGLARRRPVLMLVEDAHWIDPTLSDLLSFAVERVQDAPVLALVTHRSDFRAPWGTLANATTLPLSPLPRHKARVLVGSVAGDRALLPLEVVEQIVAKTDGVPLFVEELTKTMLERSSSEGDGDAHVPRELPLAALAIPASLQDSLLARIDRSIQVKEVAQVGAVLGREFDYEHLAALSDLPESALRDALGQLLQAGLIHQRGLQQTGYVFKHALMQDAAYGTLTLERRRHLHARCAEVLLQLSPDTAKAQPEVFAHHFAEGGHPVHAAEYWLRAGRLAVGRSANVEAVAHLTNGLRVLDGAQDVRRRAELETALQLELGMPLIATRGYGARETVQAWERAHALAEGRGDGAQLVRALYGLWAVRVALGRVREALSLAERVLAIAAELGDDGIMLVGRRVRGVTLFLLGEVAAARDDLERASRDYDPARHRVLAFRFGQDQRVSALAVLSAALWLQGSPEEAERCSVAALNEAKQLGHVNTHAYALAYGACALAWLRRDFCELDRLSDELLALSMRYYLGFWQTYALSYKGWALSHQSSDDEGNEGTTANRAAGLDMLREAHKRFRLAGDGFCDPMHLGMLAEALGRTGAVEEAIVHIDEAVAEAEARSNAWCLPELMRLKSRLLLQRGWVDCEATAGRVLHAALDQVRRKCLQGWEGRVLLDLAKLDTLGSSAAHREGMNKSGDHGANHWML